MTSLHAAARTTGPDGREWEIYAYRFRLPKRTRRRLAHLVIDVPRAFRATEWTIEAVSWAPYPISYLWSTTRERRGQVLASVEGQLARGETPMPRNARQILS
jgi:hypothetical protein